MAWHITVGAGLGALVDPVVEALSDLPADPFAPQVVAVPSEGVRSWLTWQLSRRLGGRRGVVANIDWVFPSTIVGRALGQVEPHDPWDVDVLTWSVHTLLSSGRVPGVPGSAPDATRSRAIADLFDRYGHRRPGMVAAWERGHDVDVFGRPLAEGFRWQPQLWRALVDHYEGPSSAVQHFDHLGRLAREGPPGDVPGHVVLVGVTTLPPHQLEVLAALARHREVHLLAPVPSLDLWERLRQVVGRQNQGDELLDVARAEDPTAFTPRHPLLAAWGRASREAQFHVARFAQAHGVSPRHAPSIDLQDSTDLTVLDTLRRDLLADRTPAEPVPVTMSDRSLRWHRCHGPARQAEVLADVLAHVFEERDEFGRPRFEPRDVAVLCPDVITFGPLIQAAFAGAPDQGVPAIPVRVADRTLSGEAPLSDVVAGLMALLDRRWRREDVLALARLAAVRRRFGLSPEHLGVVADWLEVAQVRWGLTPEDHQREGLPPDLRAYSLQSGLDQLVVGAVMASDAGEGPGGVVATGDLEGDDVELLGAFAELVDRLAAAVDDLARPATVREWTSRLQKAIGELAELPDAEAWQWGVLARDLEAFADAATLARAELEVDPVQLGELVVARLDARAGWVRFDTGAVTVSTLAGQRGVPRPVICLVGLDEGALSSGLAAADDLVAASPVVGDPDGRAEVRAMLLDAVLAAQERLLLFSAGFDVRTNDEVAPAVALAELIDVVDEVAGGVQARGHWVIDHPRQAWSPRSFQPGELGEPGPFSFHRGALAMFERARGVRDRTSMLTGVLPAESGDRQLLHVTSALDNAVEALLRYRCGVVLPETSETSPQVIPLSIGGLAAWAVRDDVLRAVLEAPADDDADAVIHQRLDLARRRGALPPLALGETSAEEFRTDIGALVRLAGELGAVLGHAAHPIDVHLRVADGTDRVLRGRVDRVGRGQLLRVSPSRFHWGHVLQAWVELAAVTLTRPDESWEAIVVARAAQGSGLEGHLVRLVSVEAAREVLAVATQFSDRARRSVLPLTGSQGRTLYREGPVAARAAWDAQFGPSEDRWMQWALGDTEFDELLTLAPWSDESGPAWGDGVGRLERWSHRLWSTFDTTTRSSEVG